jgi:hypothetical protein
MGTAVGGAFINMTASVKKLTLKQLDAIPDIQIRALSDSFTAMIKGSKNIKNGVRDWCAAFLPPDGSVVSVRFLKRLLLMIAVANVSTIKLARWGAGSGSPSSSSSAIRTSPRTSWSARRTRRAATTRRPRSHSRSSALRCS